MKPWLVCSGHTVRLTLHVQPGARKTEVAGEHGDCLKIRLAAPPVDGKANTALLSWLADCFVVLIESSLAEPEVLALLHVQ